MSREQVSVAGLIALAAVGLVLMSLANAQTNLQPIIAVAALVVLFCLPDLTNLRARLALSATGALYTAYGFFPLIVEKTSSGSLISVWLPDMSLIRNWMFATYIIAAILIFFIHFIFTDLDTKSASVKAKLESEADAIKKSWQ